MIKTLFSLNRDGVEKVAVKETELKFAVVYGTQVEFFEKSDPDAFAKAKQEFDHCVTHFLNAEYGYLDDEEERVP